MQHHQADGDDQELADMSPVDLPHPVQDTGRAHAPAVQVEDLAEGDRRGHARAEDEDLRGVGKAEAGGIHSVHQLLGRWAI